MITKKNMFEKQIEITRARIANSIDGSNKYVYLRDLLQNDGIEPCFKTYFTAEVSWWIYREQLLRKKNKNFDLDHENIKSFYEKIDELYMKTARFDMAHIEKLTDNAVKTILNFLVRPQTTLKWFIYRGELTKNFYEMILRLDYFYNYSYLKNSIISYFGNDAELLEQKILITSPEFSDALVKIDSEHVSNMDNDGFVDLITPVFEFFNYGKKVTDETQIPIEAMILFFDDKSLGLLKEKTESMLFDNDKKLISIIDIKEMLESNHLSEPIGDLEEDITVGSQEDAYDIPDFDLPESKVREIEGDEISEEEISENDFEEDIPENIEQELEDEKIEEEIDEISENDIEGDVPENFDEEDYDVQDTDSQEANGIADDNIVDKLEVADLEEFTESEDYGEGDSIYDAELDNIPELSDDTINELEEIDDSFEDQATDEDELMEEYDTEDNEQLDEEIIPDDIHNNENEILEDYPEDISEDDLLETIIDDAGELEEEEYELEDISDEELSEIEAELETDESDMVDNHPDEEITEDKTDHRQHDIPNEFMNNVFHSVFEIFGEDQVDLHNIQNADKDRVSEILSRSMTILEESLQEMTFEDDAYPNDDVANEEEQNDGEAEFDEIELMKQSLGLVDEEEETEPSNLAEAIAKKFVEEAAKPPQDEPIISDEENDDLKDLINQDFEDDEK
jgi:hypothetical protein